MPEKSKLDWFKLDCSTDDKIELIEAEFGLQAFAVVVRLWQRIYGGEGYYCEWNEDVALVFAKKNNVGAGVVSEIVDASIKRGIFDKGMYEKYGILTSHGIQSRYFEAVGRRKCEKIKSIYLLREHTQNSEIDNNSVSNVSNSNSNVSNSAQRREDKKREDKSREEICESAAAPPSSPSAKKHKYGEYKNVLLTDEELSKLKAEIPNTQEYIERLSSYIASTGKSYKSHFATIRNWHRKDGDDKKAQSKPKKNPIMDDDGDSSFDTDEWYKQALYYDPEKMFRGE